MPQNPVGTTPLYRVDLGLLTDFYQLTMAAGYVQHGMAERESVFHLFFRRAPFGGSFAVACGTAEIPSLLKRMKFGKADVDYLQSQAGRDGRPLFSEDFLRYLAELKWSVTIDAVPEGTICLPQEPLVRVRGPLLQCQLLETALLTLVNYQTLVATKAARVCRAAVGKPVFEFGLRRAQGIDGGLTASRAAYVGGCHGTSNVLAGRLFEIPIRGTHAHSWVMAHDAEEDSFRHYAETMPGNTVLLVDTYNTRVGVHRAVRIACEMKARGQSMSGIRLDSGDLVGLSRMAREALDHAGVPEVKIVASNDLDEYEIERLERAGAAIDIYAVGTKLVTAYDQPALGGVYKLAAIRTDEGWRYKVKRSEDRAKSSLPGILDTVRHMDPDSGRWLRDEIVCESPEAVAKKSRKATGKATSRRLLERIVRSGKPVSNVDLSLASARRRLREELTMMGQKAEMFDTSSAMSAELSRDLVVLRDQLLAEPLE